MARPETAPPFFALYHRVLSKVYQAKKQGAPPGGCRVRRALPVQACGGRSPVQSPLSRSQASGFRPTTSVAGMLKAMPCSAVRFWISALMAFMMP